MMDAIGDINQIQCSLEQLLCKHWECQRYKKDIDIWNSSFIMVSLTK